MNDDIYDDFRFMVIIVIILSAGLVLLTIKGFSLEKQLAEAQATVEQLTAEKRLLEDEIEAIHSWINFRSAVEETEEYVLPLLLMAIIDVESGGNPNAIDQKNKHKAVKAQGIMQVRNGSFCPIINITSGSKIFANLVARAVSQADSDATPEDILHRALTSYNRGWTGANRFYARTETFHSGYSKKVMNKFWEYKRRK